MHDGATAGADRTSSDAVTTVVASPSPADQETVGRLVAVNVGLPRDVSWRGRTVHTGVWKSPVEGPQVVRTLNIDGDGQGDLAGHGGPNRAVMVYQLASYAHWRQELGRDDLTHGQFGENFTVDGLADDEVCIGDEYRIGSAVFQVSQPRVTCYRVGLRMAEPRLPALLVSHRRPGFYLRVLVEGVVRAGDLVVKVRADPAHMTVAEVDALLYLPGHDRDGLRRAMTVTALSQGWQESFRSMLEADQAATGNAGLTTAAPPPAWTGFRPAQVVDIVPESDTVVSLRLAPTDGEPLPAGRPGQFVVVRLVIGDGHEVTRSYSLSGPPDPRGYRISVKRETHGVVSNFLNTTLRSGATLEMAAPRGAFLLAPGDGPVLLLSAGIGVTPVLAMLHELADTGSVRQVWWLHGARNGREHPFAAEVADLLARLPRSRSEICYSAPLPTDRMGKDYTRAGRLDAAVLRELPLPPDAHAYVCGPTGFMSDIRSALTELGLDPTRISTEIFGAGPASTPGIAAGPITPPHQPAGEPGHGPAVTFSRSGLTTAWRDDANTLLELAEACDVPTRWSCRTGICHTCETGLLAGTVTYDPPLIDEPADGNVLICCAAASADVVLDL